MHRAIALLAAALLVATLAAACGDGGSNGTTPSGTASPSDGTSTNPGDFERARDAFAQQLGAIGANIGAVPDDVRAQLLGQCRALGDFADPGEVGQLCDEVQRAMDTSDPGLIDLVLNQLAQLQGQ